MAEKRRIRRILVTVDPGNSRWQDLIRHAARLAKALDAELHTLFVEDEDVQTAAELPFTVEISLHRARRQDFSPEDVSRAQRQHMQRIRSVFESTLRETQLRGGFAITHRRQLLESFRQGDIFWLHSRTSIARLPMQAPAVRDTLYLIYAGTEDLDHLLAVAHRLLQEDFRRLVVFNLTDSGNDSVNAAFADLKKPVECLQMPPQTELDALLGRIDNRSVNTVLLPRDSAVVDNQEELLQYVADYRFEVLLVR